MKKIISIGAVLLVFAAIVLTLARNKAVLESKNVVADRSSIPVAVTLTTASKLPATEQIKSPATLMAQEEASITSSSTGRIISLAFDLGDAVKRGQVLGRLDVDELKLKLQSVEVDIEKLKRDVDRNKILVEGNAINAKSLQDSKYDLDTKVLEAEQLRKQISNGNVVSPISGVISEKGKEDGEYVNTGEVLGKVVNISSLKARVYIGENKVFKLTTGQKATMTTEVLPGASFTGKITFISPQGDASHNYQVELSIENNKSSQLRAGMYAVINFHASDISNVLQIPKSALVDGIKNPYVFVAEGNKAVEKKITIGRELGNNIEVISGIEEGDRVIVTGQINIVNGSNVKAVANK